MMKKKQIIILAIIILFFAAYLADRNEEKEADYIVNTNSRKIHLPTCSSVDDMAEHNKWYYVGSLEDLKEQGYTPCKRCLKGRSYQVRE